jgi:hypothetical protein
VDVLTRHQRVAGSSHFEFEGMVKGYVLCRAPSQQVYFSNEIGYVYLRMYEQPLPLRE